MQPSQTIMSASSDFSIKFWIRECDDGGAFCLTNKTTPILCSFEGFYCPPTHPDEDEDLTPPPSVNGNSSISNSSVAPAAVIVKPVECPQGHFCPGNYNFILPFPHFNNINILPI